MKYFLTTPNGYLGVDGFTNSKKLHDAGTFSNEEVINSSVIQALLAGNCGCRLVPSHEIIGLILREIKVLLIRKECDSKYADSDERFNGLIGLTKRIYE